ncbi:MAG: hypothetical protein AB1730_05680 [Myxococcota bacterium]|jgi:hypothetical protein
MRRVAILLMGLLVVSGCRKKTAPEFYQLESSYSILVARDGDDAYVSDEMAQVLEGLKQISPDAVEGPKAAALVAKIQSERDRVEREAKAAEAALAAAGRPPESPPATSFSATPTGLGDAPPAGADTGAADVADAARRKPWGGMSVAEFQRMYGDCFEAGSDKALPGQAPGTAMKVKDDAACRAEFGSSDPDTSVFYVFGKDGLAGQLSEKRTVKETVTQKPAPTPVDAGPSTFLLIPGAPLPEGLQAPPAPPPAE